MVCNGAFLVGAEDQQASRRLMPGHVGEQIEAGRVGPLKIVENEHQRPAGGQCGKERPRSLRTGAGGPARGQRRGGRGDAAGGRPDSGKIVVRASAPEPTSATNCSMGACRIQGPGPPGTAGREAWPRPRRRLPAARGLRRRSADPLQPPAGGSSRSLDLLRTGRRGAGRARCPRRRRELIPRLPGGQPVRVSLGPPQWMPPLTPRCWTVETNGRRQRHRPQAPCYSGDSQTPGSLLAMTPVERRRGRRTQHGVLRWSVCGRGVASTHPRGALGLRAFAVQARATEPAPSQRTTADGSATAAWYTRPCGQP